MYNLFCITITLFILQQVNIAAQTLSNSVATALEYLCDGKKEKDFAGAEPTIKFIKLVDKTFDILNSKNPFAKGYKAPLRVSSESCWRPILEEAVDYFSNCKDVTSKLLHKTPKKTPFIGFVVTIKSMISIYENYVKSENSKLNYMLTYKFSQDHLELFFCSVR